MPFAFTAHADTLLLHLQNSGKMLDKEIMPKVSDPTGQVNTDAYSAADFFSKVCAPRCVRLCGLPPSQASKQVPVMSFSLQHSITLFTKTHRFSKVHIFLYDAQDHI
jgi:hypothetical protein